MSRLIHSALLSGACGYAGNNGLATQAWSVPQYGGLIAEPWWGGWIMAEQGTSVVRRVLANGIIVLVAGTGSAGSLGMCCASLLPSCHVTCLAYLRAQETGARRHLLS